MREHEIPIISLFGHLLVPLQGDVTDSQMDRLRAQVLERIRRTGTDGLIIDASGVWMMDSHLCAVLGALAKAARLMGAQPVLCGLGPGVVMTLQTMGVELGGVDTALNLEGALKLLGVQVTTTHADDEGLDALLDCERTVGEREEEQGDDDEEKR